ncbi:hypothetical protein H6769_02260 [Candidatus Peribacteria bacterium]|nr:hypothetical protein [Candidatus Peribacteria bacterium]
MSQHQLLPPLIRSNVLEHQAYSSSDTKTITVTVRQNPTINSFAANSTSISAGSSTQISWTTSNVTG